MLLINIFKYYVLICIVLSVNCGVLENQVIKYEGETLELACYTDLSEKVEWGIRSIFQGYQLRTPDSHDPYRRIYTTFGFQRGFNSSGRYSISVGNGYHNLTIKNLNISETGEYVCREDGGLGRTSSTQLSVYVDVSRYREVQMLSCFVGGSVNLPCRTNFSYFPDLLRWLYISPHNTSQDDIAIGGEIWPKFISHVQLNISQTSQEYNLTLLDVQLNETGWYICVGASSSDYATEHPFFLTVDELRDLRAAIVIGVFAGFGFAVIAAIVKYVCRKKLKVVSTFKVTSLGRGGDKPHPEIPRDDQSNTPGESDPATQCLLTGDHSTGEHPLVPILHSSNPQTTDILVRGASSENTEHQSTSSQVPSTLQTTTQFTAGISYKHKRRGWVAGVTVWKEKLFVLRVKSKERIQQYEMKSFDELAAIGVKGLRDGYNYWWWYKSLTSCCINNCLYTNDSHTVFRVDLSTEKVISWGVDGRPCGLSVNSTGNVLVTCRGVNKILEYSTIGSPVRSIQLQVNHVTHPLHSVQLTDGRFVVSHEGPMHGVSLFDQHGALVTSYRNSETTQLVNWPRWIVVVNDCVLVADKNNNRVLSLNSSLNVARELSLPVDSRLNKPCCMYFDRSSGRLFVGECGDGLSVLVFDKVHWT